MPRVIIAGGGLAGLAAAAALAEAGFRVDLYESRPSLGGRASSFALGPAGELIDNSQHVLLGCCTSLLDFYRRLGVADRIRFYPEYCFVEPGGRVSVFRPGRGRLGTTLALMRLRFLSAADKLSLLRGLAAIRRESRSRAELDRLTMLDWLRQRRQSRGAIARFWRPVLVSAINEELDRMAASHGLQVFQLGLLAGAGAHEMGVPEVPLSELYEAARRLPNVTIHLSAAVERLVIAQDRVRGASVNGELRYADFYIAAVPFERIAALAPELGLDLTAFEHSPIAGIHLWFDRPVMNLSQAALLDRTIQWAFNKSGGRYVLAVVSAARSLIEMDRAEAVGLAVRELAEFFPRVRAARLERSHVIKELRATFSARPGLEAFRPSARTRIANLFLAGDWTRTGWPATMEGAVRSGYLAGEAVAAAVPYRWPGAVKRPSCE